MKKLLFISLFFLVVGINTKTKTPVRGELELASGKTVVGLIKTESGISKIVVGNLIKPRSYRIVDDKNVYEVTIY